MKTRIKVLTLALGSILCLGLPPALLLTMSATPEVELAAPKPKDALRALVAQQSNLEKLYFEWQKDYVAIGGDRNVQITIAWTEGLSTEPSDAQGWVRLDLINGSVRARVTGLDAQPADLWLVEDGVGPGMSVRPQVGDRMVRVGRLNRHGDSAELAVTLGPELFRDFWLDLVVVSRAGQTPAQSSVLLGTRSYFERTYTKTRLAMNKAREQSRSKFGPASLLSLFSPRVAEADSTQILIAHGLVGQDVGDGADLFFRGTFSGNGRTCGTCHRVTLNQEIDADFIATLPANDPLFVAELPVSQGGVPGLERPLLMRSHALILENVDGLENPTVKFTMRGVPHSLSMATSIVRPQDGLPPVERTGWSGDGAPQTGALRFFPVGAVRQHFTKRLNRVAGVDFVEPTSTQLDKMVAFSLASGRTEDILLANVTLTNTAAQAGKVRFTDANARCNFCHNNAGANTPAGVNDNFNTGVEDVLHPARTGVENFPFDGGMGTTAGPCDGNPAQTCFGDGEFNSTPLIEAADTPPFFHNNVVPTLEDAITFYTTDAFKFSPAGNGNAIPITPTDIANIGKFLRVLNAAFNTSISIQRNSAAFELENSSENPSPCGNDVSEDCGGGGEEEGKRETVDTLLALSNAEAADAIEVLSAKGLHSDAVTLLQSAITKNNKAIATNASNTRKSLISQALSNLNSAKAKFGTGLNFETIMGEGNLLF